MSRMEKFGSRAAGRKAQSKEPRRAQDDEERLPPRRQKHPSSRQKFSKWFYNSLFILFVLLVAALLMWGRNAFPQEKQVQPAIGQEGVK
ncbi:hypothetical protein [Paenibacillus beijingensis]|uniref:Uncharacterized protein n=1 Tax=Paenibacillus beijingensis TaxID=1126833 RepID=A0A0D5NPH5_9BACL|nr:hypothetical protein [Paenibacillus beijingensis]AJY77199.1 hypothetical protein VN24_24905 [Paenibacillus beijingensis]